MGKLFSDRSRPVHLGPYPLEKLRRTRVMPDLNRIPTMAGLRFNRPDMPLSIVNAMGEYQAMMDAIREGGVKPEVAEIPVDPVERRDHLKAFGYYCDASMVGSCAIPHGVWLENPLKNPDVARLEKILAAKQAHSMTAGIDLMLADLKKSLQAPLQDCRHHSHALVFLYEFPRDPEPEEAGTDWIIDAQQHRAALRAAETASVLASYIRSLGYSARAHSASASDIDLPKLAVAAGLCTHQEGQITNPLLGENFALGVVTTSLEIAPDLPLAEGPQVPLSFRLGTGKHAKSQRNHDPYRKRRFVDGPFPFETLKRVQKTTSFIDEDNVARVPKRSDMFARSLFGDLGRMVQDAAKNGNYVRKSASAFAFRSCLAAFVPLQDGPKAAQISKSVGDAKRNADNLKATAYFLGCDAVGLSRCPDWCYYSHDPSGAEMIPYHSNAISIVIDQGYETMEGASGDDWIACAQSMRAYLRFSLLGGVLAQQIRNLGYSAKVHTVMGSDVIQPPLTLLAGLGEISRIGDVILNPFLGPRLKSGTVTTNMPMDHDLPIDFGLQKFCDSCNKCARECPSGAITAGPKLMFNGYELWKPDSQKCTTYRITNEGGAMCGRCMKTCPWNLEGLFKEAPFRWMGMHFPGAAPLLAKLDDTVGNGGINPVKKWWWDIEMVDDGPYVLPQKPVNKRELQVDLDLQYQDQTLAAYPANQLPPPFPWPYPMDREAAIKAYDGLISRDQYELDRRAGKPLEHVYKVDTSQSVPVMQVVVSKVEQLADQVVLYTLVDPNGKDLPEFTAGAFVDIVVAPEFLRQYSLCSDPADRQKYQIAVLREPDGRGGSNLLHHIFEQGRKVFISAPVNQFPLIETAAKTYLMGGGIGVTPMIAMAHRLASLGRDFELHYSCSRVDQAAFRSALQGVTWANHVMMYFSDTGTRAELDEILQYQPDAHVYTCGPDRYMQAVLQQAETGGFPEDARHMEYFDVPEMPEYTNHPFTLRLAKSDREFVVPADQSATDVLQAAGISIDIKCSNGICGVCKCGIVSGDVEHRDFVLSNKQRETTVILCQSRAATENGVLEIDL